MQEGSVQEQQGGLRGCRAVSTEQEEMGQRTLGTASFLTFSLREEAMKRL